MTLGKSNPALLGICLLDVNMSWIDSERTPAGTPVTDSERTPAGTSVTDSERTPAGTTVTDSERSPEGTSVTDSERTPAGTSAILTDPGLDDPVLVTGGIPIHV
jgi:hypothetical protein